MANETLKPNSLEQNEDSKINQFLELVEELEESGMSKKEILETLTDAFDKKTIVGMLGEEYFETKESQGALKNKEITKIEKNTNNTLLEKQENFEGMVTIKDIPTYMYGYRGLGNVFEEQTDKQARTMAGYAGMHNMKTGQDNRDHFGQDAYPNREYISKGGKTSDAEIITKEQIKEYEEKQIGKKPIWGKDKNKKWRTTFEKEKKELYDVLNIYLIAHQPRGPSTIVIGIKIPKGVNPAPFKDKLAEEVFEADKKIGALFIGTGSQVEDKGGQNEYFRRQNELKKVAQELFLKYANEQLRKNKSA